MNSDEALRVKRASEVEVEVDEFGSSWSVYDDDKPEALGS